MRKIMMGLLAAGLMVCTASAQLMLNPAMKAGTHKFEVGAALAMSSVGYDGGDVDRKLIGGYGAFGISDLIDVYGSLAYSFSSDLDIWGAGDGSGFFLSGGARAKVYTWDKLTASAYAFLQYWSESYDVNYGYYYYNRSGSVDVSGVELGAGAVASYQILPELSAYAGLELVPFGTGEFDYEGTSYDSDANRDPVILRGGATYTMDKFWFRAELALVGETTILGAAGMSF